jgi:hypothetical protein
MMSASGARTRPGVADGRTWRRWRVGKWDVFQPISDVVLTCAMIWMDDCVSIAIVYWFISNGTPNLGACYDLTP